MNTQSTDTLLILMITIWLTCTIPLWKDILVIFYYLLWQSMMQRIYLYNIISTSMCLPLEQIPGSLFKSCSLGVYWVPGWDLMLRITTCLSFTFKSHHTVDATMHDPLWWTPNHGCQHQQSGDKTATATREGCNSFATKSTVAFSHYLGRPP